MSDNTDKDVAAASQVLQDMNAGRLTAWQAQQLCGWLGLPQLARSADRDLAKDAAEARQCVEQVLLAIEPQAPIPPELPALMACTVSAAGAMRRAVDNMATELTAIGAMLMERGVEPNAGCAAGVERLLAGAQPAGADMVPLVPYLRAHPEAQVTDDIIAKVAAQGALKGLGYMAAMGMDADTFAEFKVDPVGVIERLRNE